MGANRYSLAYIGTVFAHFAHNEAYRGYQFEFMTVKPDKIFILSHNKLTLHRREEEDHDYTYAVPHRRSLAGGGDTS